jgi:hypothetical protein
MYIGLTCSSAHAGTCPRLLRQLYLPHAADCPHILEAGKNPGTAELTKKLLLVWVNPSHAAREGDAGCGKAQWEQPHVDKR